MRYLLKLLTAAACVSVLIYIFCGDMHLNKTRAMSALRRTEMGDLLMGLDRYKSDHGTLPPTLSELTNDYISSAIPVSAFGYNPTGAMVSGGKSWLLITTNPANTNELIVGRIPAESAVILKPLN